MFATVVVVSRNSQRKDGGDWAAFVAETKDEAIRRALIAKDGWQKAGHGPYRILVGELTEEVTVPVEYTLKPLDAKALKAPKAEEED